MFSKLKEKGLSTADLKLIAIIAMTIDHLTWLFFPGLQRVWYVCLLHIIGRLTAPIMWFFIAEGSHYTKNPKKYITRLFVFAIISHFAYSFAFGLNPIPFKSGIFNQTSVIWSLAIAAALIFIVNKYKLSYWKNFALILLANLLSFPADWSCIATMVPFYLYNHRGDFKKQVRDFILFGFMYVLIYFIFIDKVYGILQLFIFLSIPVLSLYNGKAGNNRNMKWLFYIYYPAHLVIVGVLRLLLYGNVNILF
jgi:putative fimbrial assembly protein fimC